MARSRNWDALSDSYRARLNRAGITRESYLSGAPLRGARGHAATPEHPREAVRHPERFREYVGRRASLRDRAKRATREFINTGPVTRFDIPETDRRIDAVRNPTILDLLGSASDSERREYGHIGAQTGNEDERFDIAPPGIREGSEWWVMIDGKPQNPFWYH